MPILASRSLLPPRVGKGTKCASWLVRYDLSHAALEGLQAQLVCEGKGKEHEVRAANTGLPTHLPSKRRDHEFKGTDNQGATTYSTFQRSSRVMEPSRYPFVEVVGVFEDENRKSSVA